jgi:hypothetical protein
VLAGEIDARQGQLDAAIATLKEAAALEDAVRYYEPPLWHIPVRHTLGAVLLQAGRSGGGADVPGGSEATSPQRLGAVRAGAELESAAEGGGSHRRTQAVGAGLGAGGHHAHGVEVLNHQ